MAGIRAQPVTPEALVDALVTLLASGPPATALRVGIDGAAAAEPAALADRMVDPLRAAGRAALRVSTATFLRPAAVRLEHGRDDPDSFYEDWFDFGALRREVLSPLGPGGSRRYLSALWDLVLDRSPRCSRESAPPHAVALIDGQFLLGGGLPFDLTVHLHLSAAALRRRTSIPQHWTLPAYARYEKEVQPLAVADVVIRWDDPRRPALVQVTGHDSARSGPQWRRL